MRKTILYVFENGSSEKFSGPDNQQLDFQANCRLLGNVIVGSYDITGQLILNVGLGNNPKSVPEVIKIANSEFGIRILAKVALSEYDGAAEKVLVLHYGNVDLWSWEVVEALRRISVLCTQDCIAAKYDGVGVVINKTEPDTVIFDERYFVN